MGRDPAAGQAPPQVRRQLVDEGIETAPPLEHRGSPFGRVGGLERRDALDRGRPAVEHVDGPLVESRRQHGCLALRLLEQRAAGDRLLRIERIERDGSCPAGNLEQPRPLRIHGGRGDVIDRPVVARLTQRGRLDRMGGQRACPELVRQVVRCGHRTQAPVATALVRPTAGITRAATATGASA